MDHDLPTGFGTYKLKEHTFKSVLLALKCGYRHIDTPTLYKNEYEVGKSIKKIKFK